MSAFRIPHGSAPTTTDGEMSTSYGSTAGLSLDAYSHMHAVDVPSTPDGMRSRTGGMLSLVPRIVGVVMVTGLAVLAVVGGGAGSHTPPDRSYDTSIGKSTGTPVGNAARADLVHLGEFSQALGQHNFVSAAVIISVLARFMFHITCSSQSPLSSCSTIATVRARATGLSNLDC